MLEIKITVSCPDLVLAATALAKCLRPNNAVDAPASTVAQTAPVAPVVPAAPVAQPLPITPAASTAPGAPAVPVAPPVSTTPAPAAPPVPLAPAPQYSLDQIARAGADLVTREPAKAVAAQQLLASFGVQTVSELPKERFGEFVTALRGLGASI